MQQLKKWLQERRKIFNLTELEQLAGIPKTTLYQFLDKPDKKLAEENMWSLCVVLCQHGLDIGGWRWEYDEQYRTFFLSKQMEGVKEETIEHKSPDGGAWFEYKISEYRTHISDVWDLMQEIK